MPRTVDASMQTGLESSPIRPVVIARLEIDTDPILAWNGPGVFQPTGTGDSKLDGQVFDPVQAFVDMSDITEDDGLGGPLTIKASGASLDDPALQQLVKNRRLYLGKDAFIWFGLLDSTRGAVIPNPVRVKSGVITKMAASRDASGATVTIVVDADLSGARGRATRVTDHAVFYPSDTFSTYAILLMQQQLGISGLRGGGAPPGGGPSGPTQVWPL